MESAKKKVSGISLKLAAKREFRKKILSDEG